MPPINETATTTVKALEDIEISLTILFDQQRKLIGGTLPYGIERSMLALQAQLMRQIYSEVQAVKVAVWSAVVPMTEAVIDEPTMIYCEPATDEEEEGDRTT